MTSNGTWAMTWKGERGYDGGRERGDDGEGERG